ncbi:hypothetical protein FRC03_011281 [Tulasnella sp. 419]|nr:hypothetical protein FRC03_011281 [Tulasnella sp. 419]
MPLGLKEVLLQADFQNEPPSTTRATGGESSASLYHAIIMLNEEEDLPSRSIEATLQTTKLLTQYQAELGEKLVPKVTIPKLLSNESTFSILGVESDVTTNPFYCQLLNRLASI